MNKFGDLTDDELYALADQIENEDEDLQEELSEAEERISEQEAEAPVEDSEENRKLEEYYGEDAWRLVKGNAYVFGPEKQRRANMAAREAVKEKARLRKRKRIDIQRGAFDQNIIPLTDPVPVEELKNLIGMLTQEHARMVERCKLYINKRLTSLLNPFIPRGLRVCGVKYPRSIKRSPGFLYVASEEYGGGKMLWVTPDIPDYLEQGSERKLLENAKPDLLIVVDKAVVSLYSHKAKMLDKELRYASLLLRKRVKTYYDVLKLNPFWFELLYHAKLNDNGGLDKQ